MGSFRLAAGTRHLHRDCNFTELLVETALKSLRHSCRSELRVISRHPRAQTIPSPHQAPLGALAVTDCLVAIRQRQREPRSMGARYSDEGRRIAYRIDLRTFRSAIRLSFRISR